MQKHMRQQNKHSGGVSCNACSAFIAHDGELNG